MQQRCTLNTTFLFEKTQHNPLRMSSHLEVFNIEVHECCPQSYPSHIGQQV